MSDKRIEDYVDSSGETVSPGDQLNNVITELAKLELLRQDLSEKLESVNSRIKIYRETILPSAMEEVGANEFVTKAGLKVVVKHQIFASFPKDAERAERAFEYLRQTGNDGLVKHAITISYGRESTEMADAVMVKLEEMGVGEQAKVERAGKIHPQTLLKFLRDERKAGRGVPLEDFGAFEKIVAEIKF